MENFGWYYENDRWLLGSRPEGEDVRDAVASAERVVGLWCWHIFDSKQWGVCRSFNEATNAVSERLQIDKVTKQ